MLAKFREPQFTVCPQGWKYWPDFANRNLLFAHRCGNTGQISRTAVYCLPTGVEILARFREPQFTVCPTGVEMLAKFSEPQFTVSPQGWKCWPDFANRSLLFAHRGGNAGQISRTAVYCLPTGVDVLAYVSTNVLATYGRVRAYVCTR